MHVKLCARPRSDAWSECVRVYESFTTREYVTPFECYLSKPSIIQSPRVPSFCSAYMFPWVHTCLLCIMLLAQLHLHLYRPGYFRTHKTYTNTDSVNENRRTGSGVVKVPLPFLAFYLAAPLDKVRTILQDYAAKYGDEKDCSPLFTQMAELVAMTKKDGQVRSHVWRQTAR